MSRELTFDYVQSRLALDRETGVLTWKERPLDHFPTASEWKRWHTRYCGAEFGAIEPIGRCHYRAGKMDGRKFYSHRIVWLLIHGAWPSGQIDHIDHNGLNNKPENLRVVTASENQRNTKKNRRNKSGHMGVFWMADAGRWMAYIRFNRKQKYLGLYDNLEDAIEARKLAEIQYGYHPNHGEL